MTSAFRDLPSVEKLARHLEGQIGDLLPYERLVAAARSELEAAREALRSAATSQAPPIQRLAEQALARLAVLAEPSLRRVINASGVIIQTNLGRAPLSAAALAAMHHVGAGYSNLEYDLASGERGSRHVHLAGLLSALTGAEDGMVVNNNAAAVYLCLIALAAGREVIVSRGQAIEIGGGFRIPDVLAQSGAQLVEVGTTNRTYARDYAAAANSNSALVMRVHSSNFRLLGFVHETPLREMVAVARAAKIPMLDDLGSGTLIPTAPYGLAPEPTVQESVAAGADLVTFSGDKLLGGPQAGLIVGRRALIEQLRRHPLARALRVDKTTIAAMEATLRSYVRGRALEEIPVWRMITAPLEQLAQRARHFCQRLAEQGINATVIATESAVGGGSLPGETLPSHAVAFAATIGGGPDAFAARLRQGSPAVVARIHNDQLLCDLRTVLPIEEDELLKALVAAAKRAL